MNNNELEETIKEIFKNLLKDINNIDCGKFLITKSNLLNMTFYKLFHVYNKTDYPPRLVCSVVIKEGICDGVYYSTNYNNTKKYSDLDKLSIRILIDSMNYIENAYNIE